MGILPTKGRKNCSSGNFGASAFTGDLRRFRRQEVFVFLGDEKVASFTLSGQTAAITDIPDWELGGVELFFEREETFYIENMDGHAVYVNDVPLDDSHVIQIATTVAAEKYLPIGVTGVSMCTQRISDLMAVPTVTIFD